MQPVLIIQNDAKEGAGLLATLLTERGLESRCELGFETDYQDLQCGQFGALVVLGGAQGAYETDTYPYLRDEMALCRDFVDAGKPVSGFCLGAQILACALGGEVLPNEQKELGWYDITLTDEAANDVLMREHPKTLLAYHFHGDFFNTPPGCVNLASSEMTDCQLFRYDSNVYGFQYHAEADLPLIDVMCRNNASYMASNGIDAQEVIDESQAKSPDFERHCRDILSRWLDLLA
jgi:GMP synthase (glutamine-hydrolysing)